MRWVRAAGVAFVLVAFALPAHADRISRQARQVKQANNYKLRLSAALGLAKTKDVRAISALSYALEKDKKSTVRRIAAISLGRMVSSATSRSVRRKAVAALTKAAASDGDSKVQQNAKRSLQLIGTTSASSRPSKKGSVYLAVGKPKDRTRSAPNGTEKQMLKTVRKALRRHAPAFKSGSGSLPTKNELQKMGAQGFYIGSAVASLKVRRTGGRAEVRCSVSMRVSPWDGSDGHERLVAGKAASASGTGRVVGSSSRRGISSAKRDCVLAVVEQITTRQVVPFIRKTAANP